MLSKKKKIVLIILIAVVLNVIAFCFAFPQTFKPESATYARDFSAYYLGEWRLFHNPAKIYDGNAQPGDFQILPHPQTFKYTPSFLILFAPFLALSYQNSLAAFDLMQLALMPALAFFVYKLLKDKSLVLGGIAAIIILLDPLPSPSLTSASILGSFSPSYFSGFVTVNAHVLQTVLLIGALYFGFTKRPWLSALMFAFGVFDPRAALLAVPLLLWFNRQKIAQFITAAVIFLLATNLPFFFYYGIGSAFLRAEVNGGIISQMYQYDWIPLYAVATLTIVEIITVIQNSPKRIHFSSQLKLKNR
ncbi:MAG: glycosyltransferase family 87 protein [Candidatus Bathyarchaeia archaeon]|jgi:hypothetical protein